MKKAKPLVAVIVSDLHCGSEVGLAPPEVKTSKGNIIGFGENHHQAWLWECWKQGIAQVTKHLRGDPAVLIVNGDATEGSHHGNAPELVVADIDNHTNTAQECLTPYARLCSSIFVVKGTQCHTQNMENKLAEKLGAVGKKAEDKWLIKVNGCLLDVAHHVGVTTRLHLEASGLSIAMANARSNYLRCEQPVPKVFLRAHRHCGGVFTDGASMIGVTGGWQMLTRHGFKVVTDSIPRPSVLILDWRGKQPGSLPLPYEIVFNPPPYEAAEV